MPKPTYRPGESALTAAMAHGSISLIVLQLAIPIIFANLLQTAYQLTDFFWVGRLSAAAVAAVSFSFPISFVFSSVAGGLPIAGAVLLAQHAGRGNEKSLSHVSAQTILMVFLVSIVLTAGGYVLAAPVLRWMGARPDVLPDAVRFLQVTVIGQIFVFGFVAYQALMRGLGIVYVPMYIVLMTVLLNFALDPLFIFGYGPIPAMGCAGAAMATLCTQALASLIGFTLLMRGRHGINVHWRDFCPDLAMITVLFRLGVPVSIEQAAISSGMTAMTMLASGFGRITVAAYGIGFRVQTGILIAAIGLSMATSTVVGYNIGAQHYDRARLANRISCLIAFVGMSAFGVGFFLTAEFVARFLMPKGGAAIEQSAHFIRVMALTFGFMGVHHVLWGTIRGSGDTFTPMVLAILSFWAFRFPIGFVLSRRMLFGREGLWWSFPIGFVLTAIVTYLWYVRLEMEGKSILKEEPESGLILEPAPAEEGVG
jgi:putative MATE family efflux protein